LEGTTIGRRRFLAAGGSALALAAAGVRAEPRLHPHRSVRIPPRHRGDPELFENGRLQRVPGYITDLLTDRAIEFATRARRKPFMVYIGHKAIHPQITVCSLPAPRATT
jgi:hypothetical protein